MSDLVRILPELDKYLPGLSSTVRVLLPPPRTGDPRPEKRLVVIDGANIMQSTSRSPKKEKDLNLIALLSLARLLIKYDFEVAVYIQDKYWRPGVVRGGLEAFEKLSKYEITFMIPRCEFDDVYLFRIAKDYGGVVLSNDTYRGSNTQDGLELETMLKHYYSQVTFTDAGDYKNSMTADDHYIASHFFNFKEGNFYASVDDACYGRCKQKNIYRFRNWETTKSRSLKALDECLIKLITEEFDRANVLALRSAHEESADDENFWMTSSPPPREHELPLATSRKDRETKMDGECDGVNKEGDREGRDNNNGGKN